MNSARPVSEDVYSKMMQVIDSIAGKHPTENITTEKLSGPSQAAPKSDDTTGQEPTKSQLETLC